MSPRVFALFAVLVVACSFMNTEVAAMEKELAVVDANELLEFMGKALEVFVFSIHKIENELRAHYTVMKICMYITYL